MAAKPPDGVELQRGTDAAGGRGPTHQRLFANPVIPGFHPDPSVCRVGDTFYLVTSSFEYYPGIPIFASTDLVNWRQIGHCLNRPSQLDLSAAGPSGGLFAPTIRWHDGIFFMTVTNVSGGGHLIVHAVDPAGPWSDPVWVDQNGIDPSLFFEDGKAYFTSTIEPNLDEVEEASPGFQRGLQQCLVDPFTGDRLSESRFLWAGSGGRFPEAPHLFRRGDFYYLLAAEGGTDHGHMVTVARSSEPWGPFEPSPRNPVLSHRSRASAIQSTGHGDLVELPDGSWWMLCLGVRPHGNPPVHVLGRETFLAQVVWAADGWPQVAGSGMIELEAPAPDLPLSRPAVRWGRDDFDSRILGLQWNHLRNPDPASWSLDWRPGWLGLKPGRDSTDEPHLVFVGRRQEDHEFTIASRLDFAPTAADEAGLTVRMNETHHYDIGLRLLDGARQLVLRRRIGDLVSEVATSAFPPGPIDLVVGADADHYRFGFVDVSGMTREIGRGETRYLSTEVAGGFTGVYIGMYATGLATSAPAFWDWYDYRPC
ncbi:MAG: glycoside hydrolase family 43 protein [Bifidobacteriaceae bacterium]|jgi:alpha-N-arabinofuranosidase|nr:glycoside hydrolase family 43 protein [Bifidobacteriaceae bacterium]